MWCAGCERITKHLFKATTLWVYAPTADVINKLEKYFTSSGYTHEIAGENLLYVQFTQEALDSFMLGFFGALNGLELATTKVVTTEGDPPTHHDLGRVLSAQTFVNRYQSEWVITSIENNNFESWFQPIVKADSSGQVKPFAHEALFRMKHADGDIVPPSHVFEVASQSDLLFTLDLVARKSAVECAQKQQINGKLFINFNPSSVYDPAYCLRKTAQAISEAGLDPSQVVFEITETESIRDKNHLKGILAFYRQSGFEVALDDIGSGWSGLNLLNTFRPEYMKIDMELIRDIHKDVYKQTIVKNLLSTARQNAIISIAEGIETEDEFQWLRDNGSDLFQGYFFGKPDKQIPLEPVTNF